MYSFSFFVVRIQCLWFFLSFIPFRLTIHTTKSTDTNREFSMYERTLFMMNSLIFASVRSLGLGTLGVCLATGLLNISMFIRLRRNIWQSLSIYLYEVCEILFDQSDLYNPLVPLICFKKLRIQFWEQIFDYFANVLPRS